MPRTIRLGISTCPNDMLAFHATLHRLVDWRGLDFQFELLDIQQLNNSLHAHTLNVARASFHTALKLADKTIVLMSPDPRRVSDVAMSGCGFNSIFTVGDRPSPPD